MREFRSWKEYLEWMHSRLPVFTQVLVRFREISSITHRIKLQQIGHLVIPNVIDIVSTYDRIKAAYIDGDMCLERMEKLCDSVESAKNRLESWTFEKDTHSIERESESLQNRVKSLEIRREEQKREIALLLRKKEATSQKISDTQKQWEEIERKISQFQANRREKLEEIEKTDLIFDGKIAVCSAEIEQISALIVSKDAEISHLEAKTSEASAELQVYSELESTNRARLEVLQTKEETLILKGNAVQRATEEAIRKNVSLSLQRESVDESMKKAREGLVRQVNALELQETSIEEIPHRKLCIERKYRQDLKKLALQFRKHSIFHTYRCHSIEIREVRLCIARLKEEENRCIHEMQVALAERRRKEEAKKKSKKKRGKKSSLPAKLASRMSTELEPVNAESLVMSFTRMDR